MELDELREVLLAKPHATEDSPFGEDTLAYRIDGRIFAFLGIEWIPLRVNLKCDPDRVHELRDGYPDGILPGYYADKKRWNLVMLDGSVPQALVSELIDHAFDLVVAKLTRKRRLELGL